MATWYLYLTDIIQLGLKMATWYLYLTDIIQLGLKMTTWYLYLTDIIPSWTQNGYLISISDRYNSILSTKWLPDKYIWQILFHLGLKMATWYLYLTDIIPSWTQNGCLISLPDRYYSFWTKNGYLIYIWQILFHFWAKMAIWYLYLTNIITFWGPKLLSGIYIWELMLYFGPIMFRKSILWQHHHRYRWVSFLIGIIKVLIIVWKSIKWQGDFCMTFYV